MSAHLSDEQRLDWLQLIRSENVGPRTFRTLVNKFGGAGAALEALPSLLRNAKGVRKIKIFSRDAAKKELEAAHRLGIVFIALGEAAYPALLRLIDSSPPLLALRGDPAILQRPCCAIVGSRNASATGLAIAEKIGRGLGRERIATVSGLARGIDAAAHYATLRSGTIATLPGGHLRLYPSEHQELAAAILDNGGALITEMPLEWEPRGRDFPRRNRIVSGLALATIIVEATKRSGSLITAQFALEQNREVLAVPGSPLDPRSEGPNELIRNGAQICTGLDDVLAAIAPRMKNGAPRLDLFNEDPFMPPSEPLWDESDAFPETLLGLPEAPAMMTMDDECEPIYSPVESGRSQRGAKSSRKESYDSVAARVMALLSVSAIGVDDLTRAAQTEPAVLNRILMELELEGKLTRHGGARVSLSTYNKDEIDF